MKHPIGDTFWAVLTPSATVILVHCNKASFDSTAPQLEVDPSNGATVFTQKLSSISTVVIIYSLSSLEVLAPSATFAPACHQLFIYIYIYMCFPFLSAQASQLLMSAASMELASCSWDCFHLRCFFAEEDGYCHVPNQHWNEGCCFG
jgi:hypothetical protein